MKRFFAKREYQAICDDFNIGRIQDIVRFNGGLAAPKACVETEKGRFVIAKYTIGPGNNFKNKPWRSVLSEIAFLVKLRNLPIPEPIKDNKGRYLVNYNGFGIAVYPFLKGQHPQQLNSRQAHQLGQFLGEFHKQGLKIRPELYKRIKYYDFPKSKMEKMKPYAYDQKNKVLKKVAPLIEKIVSTCQPKDTLPQGPMHIDLKSDNELFSGNKLTGIIDFGNVYRGPLMLDVGKTIILNCTKNGKIDKRLMTAFLIGYNSRRNFSSEEMKYLTQSIAYGICATIWLDLYHVPLKLVPEKHTLGYVNKYLDAAISILDPKFEA